MMEKRLLAAALVCLLTLSASAPAEQVVDVVSVSAAPVSTPSADEIAGGREFNDEEFFEFEEGGYEAGHAQVHMLEKSTSRFDNILNPSGIPDKGLPVPYAFQFNYRTAFCTIGKRERSVASSGCGAVCMSMVIAYMTENMDQTPYTLMYRAAEEGNYNGNGLSYETMETMLEAYRVHSAIMPATKENIVMQARMKRPIILRVGPGTFTKNGHFILLRGLDGAGKVCVTDPNNAFRSAMSYDAELLEKECRGRAKEMLVITSRRKTAEEIAREIAAEEAAAAVTPTPEPTATPKAKKGKKAGPTSVPTATPVPTPEPEIIERRVCNFKSVNLRAAPNRSGRIVGTAKKGQKLDIVEVTETQKDGYRWYGVLQDGRIKYIREDLTDPEN